MTVAVQAKFEFILDLDNNKEDLKFNITPIKIGISSIDLVTKYNDIFNKDEFVKILELFLCNLRFEFWMKNNVKLYEFLLLNKPEITYTDEGTVLRKVNALTENERFKFLE